MRLPIDIETAESQVETEIRTVTNELSGNLSLLVSVEQAAAILGIGRTRFFDLVMSHAVTSVKIGRRRLIVRSSLSEFVERLVSDQDFDQEHRVITNY
ncbi:MAG: helix-turn-helix domain-containing protein [Acidimicrobiales bacterium]